MRVGCRDKILKMLPTISVRQRRLRRSGKPPQQVAAVPIPLTELVSEQPEFVARQTATPKSVQTKSKGQKSPCLKFLKVLKTSFKKFSSRAWDRVPRSFFFYSLRKASTGFFFAAKPEGINPAIRVRNMLMATRMTAAPTGSTARSPAMPVKWKRITLTT